MRPYRLVFSILLGLMLPAVADPYQSSSDFEKYAMKLRQDALSKIQPQVVLPSTSTYGSLYGNGGYPWKRAIKTTTFWIGEDAGQNNPVDNIKSSWDTNWKANYGGTDTPDPAGRRDFIPVGFIPRQNPFYVALPYNDVISSSAHKPEAKFVIPWFRRAYQAPGRSVCKGRWLAIRYGNRVAFAQWEDCGPFRTDHWQYVFGNERPMPNLNGGAGLDVSPAVRDFLGMKSSDTCDWKFVEFRDVPPGPWARYGDNNPFVQNARRTVEQVVEK
ncbi:MAG TPA: hypothetical protein VF585_10050 [Chthoniobacterales bacterium]|jgi:hypothetical protein